jgi:hypothetical protein
MNIMEAIKRVRRDERNSQYVDLEELMGEFNLSGDAYAMGEDHPFRLRWLEVWNCTDTWVGLSVLFLDNDPVAVRHQACRKCETIYHWLSEGAAAEAYEALLNLIKMKDPPGLTILDPAEEISDPFRLTYGDQVIDRTATLNGVTVEVVDCRPTTYKEDPQGHLHAVKIKLPDGSEVLEDVGNLRFALRIK